MFLLESSVTVRLIAGPALLFLCFAIISRIRLRIFSCSLLCSRSTSARSEFSRLVFICHTIVIQHKQKYQQHQYKGL